MPEPKLAGHRRSSNDSEHTSIQFHFYLLLALAHEKLFKAKGIISGRAGEVERRSSWRRAARQWQ